MPEGSGKTDAQLRTDALAVLTGNRHGSYTVPTIGLYPYQWCWDTGPIVLGWASVGEWDQAWGELDKLFSAQWPSGMVPHIVFWEQSDDYFPGPEVWSTGRTPATTGLTQPPLPVSAAARLFTTDPDRDPRASRSVCCGRVSSPGWRGSNARARARTWPRSSCTRGSRGWTTRRRGTSRSPPHPRSRTSTSTAATSQRCRPSSGRRRRSTATTSASCRRCARRDGTPRPR